MIKNLPSCGYAAIGHILFYEQAKGDALNPKPADSMPLGIIIERREVDHAWQDHEWRVVGVIPGAAPLAEPLPLDEVAGRQRYQAATLELELYPGETEGYRANLSSQAVVFVVLRDQDDEAPGDGLSPFLATVCPYEAQDYMDSGEEQVDTVALPPDMKAWLADFVNTHHVDQPFKKRKRDERPEKRS